MRVTELATRIARAMVRATLTPEMQRLFNAETIWTLAYLLADWRLGRDLAQAGLPQVAAVFDWFQSSLLHFIAQADAAQADADRTEATARFVAVVNEIGVERLREAVNSAVFRTAKDNLFRQVPPPAELTQAPTVGFQFAVAPQSRRPPDFGYGRAPARTEDIAFYRAQLKRHELTPDMRWFYEERLRELKEDPYPSAADAVVVWRAVLQGPLHPTLRRHFEANLARLQGGPSGPVEA